MQNKVLFPKLNISLFTLLVPASRNLYTTVLLLSFFKSSIDQMNQGFSLLEVLVALLIFSIAAFSIVKMNIFAIRNMDDSYLKHIAAIQKCEKKLQGQEFSL